MTALLPIFAQAAAPAAGSGVGSMAPFLFQIGAIFAIFYFLMIRPQQKQRKAHEASILALAKGDEIITAGGIIGEVVHIKEGLKDGQPVKGMDDRITIKSGESKLIVQRARIATVISSGGASA